MTSISRSTSCARIERTHGPMYAASSRAGTMTETTAPGMSSARCAAVARDRVRLRVAPVADLGAVHDGTEDARAAAAEVAQDARQLVGIAASRVDDEERTPCEARD